MKYEIRLLLYASILPILLKLKAGWIRDILVYSHALGIPFIMLPSSSSELYGLKHFIFNLQLPPRTLWFNMGLWENNDFTFPQACEHLVNTVVKYMALKKESHVLDVGFGCGDSCILLSEQYGCNVTGITNEFAQWQFANARLSPIQKNKIQLLHGSADDLSTISKTKYNHIISIDSAYHYNTRFSFFKQAYKHLELNGTLGLYDLVIDDKANVGGVFRFVANILGIPKENLKTLDEYRQQLVEAGFDNIEMTALERQQVFGGLAAFLKRRRVEWGDELGLANVVFLNITAWLFGLLAVKPWVVPVLVKADKN